MGAENYRGDILGGLMVQLVIRAATQQQHYQYAPVRIDCDNMGVVIHGNTQTQKLKGKQAQADVLQCLKDYINHNLPEINYQTSRR